MEQSKVLEDTGDNGLIEEYNFDGKTMIRKISAAGGQLSREQSIPVGTEVATKSIDGKDVKVSDQRH